MFSGVDLHRDAALLIRQEVGPMERSEFLPQADGGRKESARGKIPSNMFMVFKKTKVKTSAYGGRRRFEWARLCQQTERAHLTTLVWTEVKSRGLKCYV